MEPAPSVAFMRQMLESCEKRAGGGQGVPQERVPLSGLSASTQRRDQEQGDILIGCHPPLAPGVPTRSHEKVSLFLFSPSVGCKLTAESGTPVVRLSSPATLFARFQHLSQGCHRWRGTLALHFTW